jgi:AraC family transcriptional regulator
MKQGTRIDYFERIQRVISYIEGHLDQPLRLKELSRVACFSEYHFHRIFLATLGATVQEYVSSRRLIKGVSLLLGTSMRITDITLEAGYESLSAFNQHFKRYISLSPSQFRKTRGKGKEELFLPEIVNPMEGLKRQYRQRMEKASTIPCETRVLPDMKALVVCGRGFRDGNFVLAANQAFAAIIDCVERHTLQERIGCRLSMFPFIPIEFNDPDAVAYCGFSLREEAPVPEGAEVISITGGKYAVFRYQGPYEFLAYAWNSAYFTCAFSGRQQIRNIPPFEIYLNSPRTTSPQELRTEIHIPVE